MVHATLDNQNVLPSKDDAKGYVCEYDPLHTVPLQGLGTILHSDRLT